MDIPIDTDLDLFAIAEAAVEDLPDTGAAGLSSGSSLSSGGTVGGTFSSFGSLSTVN
jgi:hypothetical protein